MFNNLEELKAEILQGKTNEEIIQERFAYLTSPEYRSQRLPTVKRLDTAQVLFYDGFISPEEVISFNGGRISDCLYRMDDITIYEKLIDLVRNNMDKSGFNFKLLIQIVRDYFKIDENSRYYELSEYLKSIHPSNPYFSRETMPYIINEYINSNFDGSLKEFGIGYLHHWVNKTYHYDVPNIDELDEKYFKSVDWEKLDGDTELPISAIKGAGIAACTEYSILTQNSLAFLGYDTYLLGGELEVGDRKEEHNFNIRRTPNGKYEIIDSAQFVRGRVENAGSVEDIRNIQNLVVKRFTKDETDVSYTAANELRIKTPLQQREDTLSELEAKAKGYDEAEVLKEKMEQQEGQNIGE